MSNFYILVKNHKLSKLILLSANIFILQTIAKKVLKDFLFLQKLNKI